MRKIVRYFDRLEDEVRALLSRHLLTYSLIGGVGVVLFWRGVWETSDMLMRSHVVFAWLFYPPIQVVLSIVMLMLTGLFVSVFIGDRIIISGIRHEKKLEENTKDLVKEEVVTLHHVREEIRALRKDLEVMHTHKKE
ncbi:MAG TPA: hypothetical protein PLF31_02980 [Candidatus Paceibacterota bacterium]|nr:hypothetical protein [Candidatus Paceibacterota bacterium]